MSPFHDNVTPLVIGWTDSGSPLTAVQGTLALDLAPRLTPPSVPDVAALPGADVVPVSPAVRRELHRWSLTFAQACVEVVLGDRPVSQLVRWTTPAVHRELAYRAGVVSRAGVRAAGRRRPPIRAQVQNVRTCFVAEDRVEMSVRVRYGERSRAIAGRLDVIGGRWQCTALEWG
jgi:hypothetical protein